jgi:hypothetical protein
LWSTKWRNRAGQQDRIYNPLESHRVIEGSLEGDGNRIFECDLRTRQPNRMLPSKVGNLATFVVFQVTFTFFFPQ